jgi:hypothetical protein
MLESRMIATPFAAMDPVAPVTSNYYKVRARFDDLSVSAYSALRNFSADGSLVGWWLLNGTVADASSGGHVGALQGGAAFAAGLIGQALSLDGVNDSFTVANTNDHNFGTGDFTLAAWVRPGRDGVAEALITKRSSSNGYELYRANRRTSGLLRRRLRHRPDRRHGDEKTPGIASVAVRSSGMVYLYIDDGCGLRPGGVRGQLPKHRLPRAGLRRPRSGIRRTLPGADRRRFRA